MPNNAGPISNWKEESSVRATRKEPVYATIADTLRGEISLLGPSSLLPTEAQLARRFGVSRVTVRAALDLLESNGLVTRIRGRGTIVNPRKITRHFSPHFTFEQDMMNQGIEFATRVLSFEAKANPPDAIRGNLKLSQDETAGCLSLVRLVNDQIVCHDLRYYPADISVKIDPTKAEVHDACRILEEAIGAPVSVSHWESEIVSASGEVGNALGVASRTLIVANTYAWFLEDGTPVESGIISYRIDRCKFRYETRLHAQEK